MPDPSSAEHRAVIAPVPPGEPRPLWSVMIPTFNCAAYLRETLAAVLAQDPGPERMQIEVVDDCSTADDPERVVAEVGGGRVAFFRQASNVGHVRNFETCLQRARGRLVHQLHGDDLVRVGFYQAMERAFEREPAIGAAFCRQIYMDERGHWQGLSALERAEPGVLDGWLERLAEGQRLQTPSIVVRREVYERLGGFDRRLAWVEDWEMWVRVAAHHPVWYEPEPLALYRIHTRSSSGRLARSGETIRDVRRAIEINRAYLPAERVDAISRTATLNCAFAALRRAHRMLDAGEFEAPASHMREAVRSSASPRVLAGTARLFARWAWRRLRSRA